MSKNSRINRYEKQRKNTQWLSVIGILGVVIAALLIAFMIVDSNDADEVSTSKQGDDSTNILMQETESEDLHKKGEDGTLEEESEEQQSKKEDNEQDGSVSESADPNVIQVVTKDWQPIGTTQQEPHIATYKEESKDWQEMKQAIQLATGLKQNEMILWWLGNGGGPQKFKATVTNNAQTNIYRVYGTWIPNEGWKPSKVERLKENDKK